MMNDLTVVTTLRASDLERAKQFYTETLDLPLVMEMGGAIVVGSGDNRLAIYQRENSEPPENTVATWETEDVHALARKLKERGVTAERYDMPGVEYDDLGVAKGNGLAGMWFTDSEGNVLQILQVGG